MLKINNKSISDVYDKETTIGKIYKGVVKVYESWKKLTASGVPPITLEKCKNANLIDYKIYGNSKQGKLPSEYQQVEYIESTGTQYIDTGKFAPLNTDIYVRFQINDTTQSSSNNGAIFGGRSAQTSNTCTLFYLASTNPQYFRFDRANQTTIGKANQISINNQSIYEFSYINNIATLKNLTENQEISSNIATPSTFTTNSLNLFAVGGGTIFKGKIFEWKYWEKGELLQNFIPCYRKNDNVVGMYDTINNVFYENAGTGEFLKGKNVLPNEYQQVEYIESTGTQYIDSGVPLKSGLKTIVDWIYADADSGNSYTGGHIGSPGNRWLIGSQRVGKYYFAVGATNVQTEFQIGNRDVIEAYWENKNSYIIVNSVKSTIIKGENYALSEEPSYTFYMGAVNRNGSASSKSKLTIYNWKFYQDDVLIRDFMPCYRKSDNVIGMYDLVTGTFYTNNGTGTFLKGNDVITTPTPSTPIEIESVGNYAEENGKYVIPVKVNDAITNIYLNEPLRKMEDYIDYIDYKNQKVIKLVDKKTFDGTENWELHTTISGGAVFRLDNVLTPLIKAPMTSTYMTHFVVTNIYSTSKFTVGLYRFSSNAEVTKITDTRLYVSSSHTTVEDFKEWLSQNKPSIYYPTDTTIEETIELPNILLNKGANIIEVDTSILPSNMDVKYMGKE